MDPVPQLNVLKAEVFSVKLKKQNKDIKCTKNNLKQPFWQILLKARKHATRIWSQSIYFQSVTLHSGRLRKFCLVFLAT